MRESRLGPSRDQEKDSFVLLVISYQVKWRLLVYEKIRHSFRNLFQKSPSALVVM